MEKGPVRVTDPDSHAQPAAAARVTRGWLEALAPYCRPEAMAYTVVDGPLAKRGAVRMLMT
jgi:hypothetical protein